jgi:hypothetical protein
MFPLAKGHIHRSLGQRPRSDAAINGRLAEGHIQRQSLDVNMTVGQNIVDCR